jgi:hypothetical protein
MPPGIQASTTTDWGYPERLDLRHLIEQFLVGLLGFLRTRSKSWS